MDGEWREDEGDRERGRRERAPVSARLRGGPWAMGVQAPTAEPERAGGVDWR